MKKQDENAKTLMQDVEGALAQMAKKLERFAGVQLLGEVADAYHKLSKGAKSVAAEKRAGVDLSPDGEIASLAKEAAAYATSTALPLEPPGFPGPCESLGRARENLATLDKWVTAGLWKKFTTKGKEKDLVQSVRENLRRKAAQIRKVMRIERDANYATPEASLAACFVEWFRREEGFARQQEVALYTREITLAEVEKRHPGAAASAEEWAENADKVNKHLATAAASAEEWTKIADKANKCLQTALAVLENANKGDRPKKKNRYEVTQKDVALKLGVNVRTVKNWEAGKGNPPNGYTRDFRRNKADFAMFAQSQADIQDRQQRILDAASPLSLGNRRGMSVRKGTK